MSEVEFLDAIPVMSKDGKMHVFYKTEYYDEGTAFQKPENWVVYSHKFLRTEYCCIVMAKHFGRYQPETWLEEREKIIDFGQYHDPGFIINKGNPNVTLANKYLDDECGWVYNYFPIQYCPFCGKEILTHRESKVKRIGEPYQETVTKYKVKEVPFDE